MKTDEVKALVFIEVPDPFDDVVLAHSIMKDSNGEYSKEIHRWKDTVKERNFYYSVEAAKSNEVFSTKYRFYHFQKTPFVYKDGESVPWGFVKPNIDNFYDTTGAILTNETMWQQWGATSVDNPNDFWTKNEPINRFVRTLRNIQVATLFMDTGASCEISGFKYLGFKCETVTPNEVKEYNARESICGIPFFIMSFWITSVIPPPGHTIVNYSSLHTAIPKRILDLVLAWRKTCNVPNNAPHYATSMIHLDEIGLASPIEESTDDKRQKQKIGKRKKTDSKKVTRGKLGKYIIKNGTMRGKLSQSQQPGYNQDAVFTFGWGRDGIRLTVAKGKAYNYVAEMHTRNAYDDACTSFLEPVGDSFRNTKLKDGTVINKRDFYTKCIINHGGKKYSLRSK